MLIAAAHHGRLLLILGLVIGAASPAAAQIVRPYIPHLIGALLCLAAFRIGGRVSLGSRADLGRAAVLLLIYQIILPLGLLGLLTLAGLSTTTAAIAAVLMLTAPTLTGAPNFTILLGHDPAISLRMLLLGTAVMPLTAAAILSLIPDLVTPAEVTAAATRLFIVILGTVALAFTARALAGEARATKWQPQIDGLSAILLAAVVVGLMTAIGPALRTEPMALLAWLAYAFALNFGLQILAKPALHSLPEPDRAGATFMAGNRNIGLFLIALPPEATDALLMFIGCYQVPMYLTPMLLGWLYRPQTSRSF